MHVSYMKIAIYALTFLTYAYSGYGSSTITHLRDAIIAAEAIYGDVLKNLITIVNKFRTVHEVFDAAAEETCVFKCSSAEDGQEVRPVQNKLYTPTADGCGSLGLRINTEYLPALEMEICCNEHDICYETCNSDKELCDLDLKRCLYKYCESYERSISSDIIVRSCKGAAKMLFTGTLTLGCKSFRDSQKRTCYCASPKYTKDERTFSKKNFNEHKTHMEKKRKYNWKHSKDV